MRLWLEKAGVFSGGTWRVDEARLHEVLGDRSRTRLEVLARFSPPQRAFLRALVNIDHGGPYTSNEIEKLAAATYGVTFNEKSLPKDVLYPLQEAGFVDSGARYSGGRQGSKAVSGETHGEASARGT